MFVVLSIPVILILSSKEQSKMPFFCPCALYGSPFGDHFTIFTRPQSTSWLLHISPIPPVIVGREVNGIVVAQLRMVMSWIIAERLL